MTPFASNQPPQSHMLIFPLHKSLLTDDFASPQNLAYSSSHTDSADSNSVFAWELSWVMLSTFLHPERLLTHRRTVSGQRPRRAKCLCGNSICPGCFGSAFLSQLWMAWPIFCRQIRAQCLCSISLLPILCLVAAHSQPLCCTKSSHRDFWTDTLLSPALEHPLVLPVAPAYLHIIYGPAQPASLRVSLLQRSERKPHRLCPSQQWCLVSGLPLQPQISHQHGHSSWWKGAAPLSPVPAGVSGAGSVAIPGLAF